MDDDLWKWYPWRSQNNWKATCLVLESPLHEITIAYIAFEQALWILLVSGASWAFWILFISWYFRESFLLEE